MSDEAEELAETGAARPTPLAPDPDFEEKMGKLADEGVTDEWDLVDFAEVETGKLSPSELGHDFLFLQNTSDPTIRFPAETSDVSLPVGRVTRILHAKDATQQFCRFFVFFCSYLIFIYIFFATYDCHQQYMLLKVAESKIPGFVPFTQMKTVNETNTWIETMLPLLKARLDLELMCPKVWYGEDYIEGSCVATVNKDFYGNTHIPPKLNLLPPRLDLSKGESADNYCTSSACRLFSLKPPDPGRGMAIDWTLGLLLVDAQWSQLLIRYSANMNDPSLSDTVSAFVTYSGRTHERSRTAQISAYLFFFVWLHRVYIIFSEIYMDVKLLQRFWFTSIWSTTVARENYKISRSEDEDQKTRKVAANKSVEKMHIAAENKSMFYAKLVEMVQTFSVELVNIIFPGLFFITFFKLQKAESEVGDGGLNDETYMVLYEQISIRVALNLFLLLFLFFKLGGEYLTAFRVVKRTFLFGAKELGNFLLSLIVAIIIFIFIGRILFGIPNANFAHAGKGFFNVFDHVLNTYSEPSDSIWYLKQFYFLLSSVVFLLMLSQFVVAVLVGAFEEVRAEAKEEAKSEAVDAGWIIVRTHALTYRELAMGFLIPKTLVHPSHSNMSVHEFESIVNYHSGSLSYDRICFLFFEESCKTLHLTDAYFSLWKISDEAIAMCTEAHHFKALFRQLRSVQDRRDTVRKKFNLLRKTKRYNSAEGWTHQENTELEKSLELFDNQGFQNSPIFPAKSFTFKASRYLPRPPNERVGQPGNPFSPTFKKPKRADKAALRRIHSLHIHERGEEEQRSFLAAQRSLLQQQLYDFNETRFETAARSESIKLAKVLFSDFGTVPATFYHHPGAYSSHFHTHRVFCHHDRLKLCNNRGYMSKNELKKYGLSVGADLRHNPDLPKSCIVPNSNMADVESRLGISGNSVLFHQDDIRRNRVVFEPHHITKIHNPMSAIGGYTVVGESYIDQKLTGRSKVCPTRGGPFRSCQSVSGEPSFASPPEGWPIKSFSKDHRIVTVEIPGEPDFVFVNRFIVADFAIKDASNTMLTELETAAIPEDLDGAEGWIRGEALPLHLSGLQDHIIQPGRNFLFMSSLSVQGAMVRRNSRADSESVDIHWCDIHGVRMPFADSLMSQFTYDSEQLEKAGDDLSQRVDEVLEMLQERVMPDKHKLKAAFQFEILSPDSDLYRDKETGKLDYQMMAADGDFGSAAYHESQEIVELDLGMEICEHLGVDRSRVFFINPYCTGISFNDTQMAQFKTAFNKFDHFNGARGEINAEEAVAVLDTLGLTLDQATVIDLMSRVAAGTGSMHFAEFCKLLNLYAEQHHIISEVSMDQFSYEGFGMLKMANLRAGHSKTMDERFTLLEAQVHLIHQHLLGNY